MQSFQWYVNRLQRMGGREILWRVRGAARDILDLVRIPLRLYPQLDAPVPWSRFEPGVTLAPPVMALPPARHAALLAQSDRIVDGQLDFFHHQALALGQPIDWHRDWNQDLASPRTVCPLVDYRVASVSGDCKEVWEPNRHHQLVILARAWHLTRDPRYADSVWRILDSWLDANPFGYGMNWKNPLELGVRVINWIWALDLVRGHPCDEALWQRVHQALYQTVWDLSRKFSQGSSANNHLVGEAAGVFIATVWLPDLPDAVRLRQQTRQILIDEIDRQFHVDGGTREQALGYQFFSVQFFTLCALLAERSGEPMPQGYMTRLQAGYDYLSAFGEGGAELPFYGDKDDGYVLELGDGLHNVQAIPALASVLFSGSRASTSESGYWLCGAAVLPAEPDDADSATPVPALVSRAFRDAGHYLLQCGAAEDRISIQVDCAQLGYGSIAAHGHADALAFTLRMGGLQMLVDPGTYDYFTHPQWRDAFRHTRSHNTVCVDDTNQSQLLGAFLWGRQAQAECLNWEDSPEQTVLRGTHDGYQTLPDPVNVERSYRLDKVRRTLQIEDVLTAGRSADAHATATGEHAYAAGFHCHPDCVVTVEGRLVTVVRANRRLQINLPEGVRVDVYRGDEQTRLGWFSPGYHQRLPATAVIVRTHFRGDLMLRYELALAHFESARIYDLRQHHRSR